MLILTETYINIADANPKQKSLAKKLLEIAPILKILKIMIAYTNKRKIDYIMLNKMKLYIAT